MGVAAMEINVLLEVCSFFWAPNRGSKLLRIPSAIRTIITREGEKCRKQFTGRGRCGDHGMSGSASSRSESLSFLSLRDGSNLAKEICDDLRLSSVIVWWASDYASQGKCFISRESQWKVNSFFFAR